MKVGTVYSSIAVDRDSRIYSGSEDPIFGNVVLEFRAWDREKGETNTTELFGPLTIHVTLEGDLKNEVDEDYMHNISHPEYRDERKLLQLTQLVYDGQLRAPVGEKTKFPFRIFFPKRAWPTPQQRKNGLEESNWDVLPPALQVDFAGTYGAGQSRVEYRVKAEIEVPGIKVDIATRGVSPTLKYRPSISEKDVHPATNTFDQAFSVTSEDFIPESERPHGFRAKAKALLKDVEPPTFAFDLIWMDMPNYIRPDQPTSFKVGLRANTERTTSTQVPEVTIQEGEITILGFCGIRVVPKYHSPEESAEMKDLNDETVNIKTLGDGGPFSKADDYTKTVVTQPLPYLPCSFAMERLSRYYKARVNMILMVGSQKIKARREFPVTVLPPVEHEESGYPHAAQSGPSHSSKEHEQLPAYS